MLMLTVTSLLFILLSRLAMMRILHHPASVERCFILRPHFITDSTRAPYYQSLNLLEKDFLFIPFNLNRYHVKSDLLAVMGK